MWCGKGEKANTLTLHKTTSLASTAVAVVLDGAASQGPVRSSQGGIGHSLGLDRVCIVQPSGLQPPSPGPLRPGLSEPNRGQITKMTLRKRASPYNYRGIINIFVPFNGATVDGARHRRRL